MQSFRKKSAISGGNVKMTRLITTENNLVTILPLSKLLRGYTRAYQNAIKKIKDLLSENRLLYLEESVSEFVDEIEHEIIS